MRRGDNICLRGTPTEEQRRQSSRVGRNGSEEAPMVRHDIWAENAARPRAGESGAHPPSLSRFLDAARGIHSRWVWHKSTWLRGVGSCWWRPSETEGTRPGPPAWDGASQTKGRVPDRSENVSHEAPEKGVILSGRRREAGALAVKAAPRGRTGWRPGARKPGDDTAGSRTEKGRGCAMRNDRVAAVTRVGSTGWFRE